MKTQFGLGAPFACSGCETKLVVPKAQSFWLFLAMLAIFWVARYRFPAEWGGAFGLLAIMICVGWPATWAVTRVERA
nr:hypothetical protein [uncultured Brevundimonas sp.]